MMDFDPLKTCALLLPQHGDQTWQAQNLRGSVTSIREQVGVSVSVEDICHVIKKGFEKKLDIAFAEACLTPAEESLKSRLMNDKYMSDKWNLEGKAASDGSKNSD
jgi:lipoate-protein ligase A